MEKKKLTRAILPVVDHLVDSMWEQQRVRSFFGGKQRNFECKSRLWGVFAPGTIFFYEIVVNCTKQTPVLIQYLTKKQQFQSVQTTHLISGEHGQNLNH